MSVDLRREVKHAGEISVLADKERQLVTFLIEDLADSESVVGCEGLVPHLAQKFADPLRFPQHVVNGGQAVLPVRGIVAKDRRLLDVDDGVDAESSDPLFHPPADVLIYFLPDLGVLPVQVRLLLMEYMQIKLVRSGQLRPAGSAKIGSPVGGQLPVGIFVPQVEELAVLSLRVLTGSAEPLVLVRTVVDHQVHEDRHVPLFCLRDQLLHVLHGAKAGIDGIIVGDIVSLVRQGGPVDGGEPDDIDAQPLQIIQFADDPLQVSDAVPVAVHKTLGIDLIGDFVMPPFSLHVHPPYFKDRSGVVRHPCAALFSKITGRPP